MCQVLAGFGLFKDPNMTLNRRIKDAALDSSEPGHFSDWITGRAWPGIFDKHLGFAELFVHSGRPML